LPTSAPTASLSEPFLGFRHGAGSVDLAEAV